MSSKKDNSDLKKDNIDELLIDNSSFFKTFLEGEQGELSQEEEIGRFELKKEQEIAIQEEELKLKREKELADEEELKRIKRELLNSLERVKLIVKNIYGNVDGKTRKDFKENKKVVQGYNKAKGEQVKIDRTEINKQKERE